MSNVSNRHTVTRFVAGKSAALSDQRLAKVGYKKTEKIKNPLPSVCASIPMLDDAAIEIMAPHMLPHIRTMLESAQDGIIRSLYESSGGTLDTITDEEIGIIQCIAFMEAENSGARLSGELIGQWFDSDISENLTVLIADKLGFTELTEDNEKVIAKHVKTHRDVMCLMAGKSVILGDSQARGIRNMLNLAADSVICARLTKKLDDLTTKKPIEELLDLS